VRVCACEYVCGVCLCVGGGGLRTRMRAHAYARARVCARVSPGTLSGVFSGMFSAKACFVASYSCLCLSARLDICEASMCHISPTPHALFLPRFYTVPPPPPPSPSPPL
jgi:hypothetical protein